MIKSYSTRFDKLEAMLDAVKKENKELKKEQKEMKETLEERDQEILKLRERINDQEQYARGWSARVLGMDIPASDATDPVKVMGHVYSRLLLPIFRGAVQTGQLNSIPNVEQVLETAHILPAKPDTIPAVICRFYSRNIRALVFRLKKDFAPRLDADRQYSQGQHPGKFAYSIFEDLTRLNFAKLRALSQHDKVHACWSVNGSLRYRLKDSDAIVRVKSVMCSVEDILKAK